MRAVVQRVARASVVVGESRIGSIGDGLLVLLGISPEDGDDQAAWLVDKVANLRVFADGDGRMNRSLLETRGAVLVVSQFTLYGDARRGRRPSFVGAAQGPEAEALYDKVVAAFRAESLEVATGEFGAPMDVELVNRGPVTILLDSDKTF